MIPRITNHVIDGESIKFDADLKSVDAAPGETFPVLSHSDAVELPAVDADDLALTLEASDKGWVEDNGFITTRAFANTGLTVVIQTPGVDFAIFVDGERVGVAGGNVGHGFWKTEFAGDETVQLGALDNATAELVLLARTPGEYSTIAAEG